jgi:hypothetical protein
MLPPLYSGMTEKIRVIRVERALLSPLSTPPDELRRALAEVVREHPELASLMVLAERPWTGASPPHDESAGLAAAARALLALSPAIRPVVTARGAADEDAASDALYVRPDRRTRAIAPLRRGFLDSAVAAEEPVIADGFVIDEGAAGEAVRRAAAVTGTPLRLRALVTEYTDAMAAERRAGMPFTRDMAALSHQVRAALEFPTSNVAVALGADVSTLAVAPYQQSGDEEKLQVYHDEQATWRDSAAAERIGALLQELVRRRLLARVDTTYDANALADAQRAGLLLPAFRALAGHGLDEEALEAASLERVKAEHAEAELQAEHAERFLMQQYLRIASDKLGAERIARLFIRPPRKAADVLAVLSAREKELVLVEHARMQDKPDKKCPHYQHRARIDSAPDAQGALRALEELLPFLVESSSALMSCRECGAEGVLCPHVRDRVRFEARRLPGAEVKQRLSKYITRIAREGSPAFFCRLCAAGLGEEDAEEVDTDRFGELGSALRARVWSLALALAPRITFTAPTDERAFAGAVTKAVAPLVLSAIAQLGKVRRRRGGEDEEDILPDAQVTAAMYVSAYALNLIAHGAAGLDKVRPGAKASEYAKQLVKMLVETQRNALARLPSLTEDVLTARFAEAFRSVRDAAPPPPENVDPLRELITQTFTVDNVFAYAADVARCAGALPRTRPATQKEALNEFTVVLGSTPERLVKIARDGVRNDPALARLFTLRPGVPLPTDIPLELALKDPRVNFYATMFDESKRQSVTARGGKALVKSPPSAKAAAPVMLRPHRPNAAGRQKLYMDAYRVFVLYTRSMFTEEARREFREALAAHREQAAAFTRDHLLFSTCAVMRLMKNEAAPPPPAEATLAWRFDAAGRRHVWDKYVFSNGVECAGRKAVVAARSKGELVGAALVDVVCSVCDVRYSALSGLDTAAVEASVAAAGSIAALLVFFEASCPQAAGAPHEWHDGVCRACGLTEAALAAASRGGEQSADARAYYDKYADAFRSARTEQRAAARAVIVEPPPPRPERDVTFLPDHSFVVRFAKHAGVTVEAVEALGSTPGRDYADVIAGRGLPPPPETHNDVRILTVEAEVRATLAEYSRLRYAARTNYDFGDIQTGDLRELERLPVLEGADRHAYARDHTPAEVLEYLIQSLCRLVLEIGEAAPGGGWVAEATQALSRAEAVRIMRNSRLLARPGNFSWSVFDADEEAEADMPADVGDVGQDIAGPKKVEWGGVI